jgi:hypothetical protein
VRRTFEWSLRLPRLPHPGQDPRRRPPCRAHHSRQTSVGCSDAQDQDADPARHHLAVVGGGVADGQPGPARLGGLLPLRRLQEDLPLPRLVRLVETDPLDPPQVPPPDLETGPAPLLRRRPYPRGRSCPLQPGEDAGRALPLPRQPNLDPYNIDEVDPNGARFRSTSHNDAAFVGQVSEQLT